MRLLLIILLCLMTSPAWGLTSAMRAAVDTSYVAAGGSGSGGWSSVASGDDTGRDGNGAWSTTAVSSVLGTSGGNNGRTAIRFPSVTVPNGATVTSATITGTATTSGTAAYYRVYGVETDIAQSDIDTEAHVNALTLTTAYANYGPIDGSGWESNSAHTLASDTSSLRTVLTEVFGAAGWSSGNDLGIIIDGNDPDPGNNWTNALYFRNWDYGDNTYVYTINISYTY